jgi:hypothetical protein
MARARISGDAYSVRLQGADRSYGPGELPPGAYQIIAVFTQGGPTTNGGTVMLEAGETVSVNCVASFMQCRVR